MLIRIAISLMETLSETPSTSDAQRLEFLRRRGQECVIFVHLETRDCSDTLPPHLKVSLLNIRLIELPDIPPPIRWAVVSHPLPGQFPSVFLYNLSSHLEGVQNTMLLETVYTEDLTHYPAPVPVFPILYTILVTETLQAQDAADGVIRT